MSRFIGGVLLACCAAWGAVTGSFFGTVADQTGAVIQGATVTQ